MHATESLNEADRLMTVCNSCRYCEGLCAVFPAMEMRRAFTSGDLNYLANLCHGCAGCYDACQFSPPHEFNVNVPQTLAKVRAESYQTYAWPRALAPMFERNGLSISLVAAVSVAIFIAGFAIATDPAVFFGTHVGPGAFYRLMPHNTMAAIFGAVTVFAVVALVMGLRAFLSDIGDPSEPLPKPASIWKAMKDAGQLRYLDGGGSGCDTNLGKTKDLRKHFHHATFYGFMLCFAATSTATLYHYLLGLEAPYPWYDLPVLLGTVGGIGLLVGPAGLLFEKFRRDPNVQNTGKFGMDIAFLAMLFLTSLTGLALLILRETSAMGMMLAMHLGVVFALFLTMPYGKFVHGIYRFAALVRYAREIDALKSH